MKEWKSYFSYGNFVTKLGVKTKMIYITKVKYFQLGQYSMTF